MTATIDSSEEGSLALSNPMSDAGSNATTKSTKATEESVDEVKSKGDPSICSITIGPGLSCCLHITPKSRTLPKAQKFDGLQGIYFIQNNQGDDLVLDLAGYDSATVLGYKKHGGDNQKWIIEPLGPGYSIKSVFNGNYITLQAGAIEGGSMITSPFPVSWEIRAVEHETELWEFGWPRGNLAFDMPNIQENAVVLSSPKSDKPTHLWRLIPVEANKHPKRNIISESTSYSTTEPKVVTSTSRSGSVQNGIDPSTLGEDEEMEVTTTTTTTTTSVSTMRRFASPKFE